MNLRRAAAALSAALTLALGGAGVAAAATPGAGLSGTGPSGTDPSARAPIPVPYQFPAGIVHAAGGPAVQLAGANDWSCRPGADKPRPVVLLHGTSGGAVTNWATYGPLLHNEGYCVFALTYGALPGQPWPVGELGGYDDILGVSVPQVGGFVDRVLEATGAEQVDLVGHSQGTLVSALVAKHERPGRVGTVASIAPLWHGTTGSSISGTIATALAGGDRARAEQMVPALAQMEIGSPVMDRLWEGGTPYAPGVRYTNLVTRHEQVVEPYTSGLEPGPLATNIVVQDGCEQNHAEHLAIVADPRTADHVLNALDPDRPREPRCEQVVGYLGAVQPMPQLPGVAGS